MQIRDDQPNIPRFNFSINSVFNNTNVGIAELTPILPNDFLLLESPISFFLLLDGSNLLLLGS